LLFHLVWCSSYATLEPWRIAVVERIRYYHPHCTIQIHSNTLNTSQPLLADLLHRGFPISIEPIDDAFFAGTPLAEWWEAERGRVRDLELGIQDPERPFLGAHLADVVRTVALFRMGGVYLDFDVLVLHPLAHLRNALGWQDSSYVNNAVLIFDKGHPFLAEMMPFVLVRYDPAGWAAIGPHAWSRKVAEWRAKGAVRNATSPFEDGLNNSSTVTIYPTTAFYPYHWREANTADLVQAEKYDICSHLRLLERSCAFHVWTHALHSELQPGSVLWRLLYVQDDHAVRHAGARECLSEG
jgi:lactosylceramide 4-alpha-galactosyltransferase